MVEITAFRHGTIYSATTFLGKCRKVVLQTRIFFFWSTTFLKPEERWIYTIKPPFFLLNHLTRTTFLEPDFSNKISTNCKNRGRRIKGPVRGPPALLILEFLKIKVPALILLHFIRQERYVLLANLCRRQLRTNLDSFANPFNMLVYSQDYCYYYIRRHT